MNQNRLTERVAYKLIHHACRLQAGDSALLCGRRDQLDLLLRLEFHALAAGARALILLEEEARLRRLLNELSPASAANERLSLLPIAQTVTHVLDLTNGAPTAAGACENPVSALSPAARAPAPDLRGLPQKTLRAWQEANHTLQAALRQHQRARIEVALPSRLQAQRLRQPFHPYNDAIWRALDADYALMGQRGRYLQAALSGTGAPLLRLSDARGAELTLRLAADAPRQCDDGILSPEALAEAGGYATMLLPAGGFRVAVAEGSAKGEAIIDAGWFQGKPLRHLRLRFHDGRVVGMGGAGAAQAEAALAAAVGAPLLGEISIGLNPAVTSLRPYPLGQEASLLAYRRAGAVFLTLGDNRAYGGSNRPALGWSLGLARAMLEVDGQVVLRGGEFVAS